MLQRVLLAIGMLFLQGPKPDNPRSLGHIDAAKKLAGNDAFLNQPYSFFCIRGNARANNTSAPELEPVKLFDNVYAVGNSETTVYVIETPDGLLMIDAGYTDRVETVLVPGLEKLGLDPAKVKYILVGHGHADHFGGSKYFQDHYGSKVAASEADWDVINAPNANANQARPKKEVLLLDGQAFQFGGVSVRSVLIPGHTPGSLAFIFPVKDNGRTRMAGIFAGTVLTLERPITDDLRVYVQSIAHYIETAQRLKVEVELQNHPIFDGMRERLATLKTLKAGDPNPFVVGNDRYLKMWNIVSECIQAEIARR